MAELKGNPSNTIYGGGDTCLHLNPFGGYRLFTLYDNWQSEDRKPLDLTGGKHMYLIFKSKKKEIRIPEVDTTNLDYTVDKVNGQVLFRIDKSSATNILEMDSKIFYITMVNEVEDGIYDNTVKSDEEVVFTGRWRDDNDLNVVATSSQVNTLTQLLSERNSSIQELQQSMADLIAQNVEYASRIEELLSENASMENEISDLQSKISYYEDGTEYTGTLIGEGTYTNIISTRQYTEEELGDALKNLETTTIE